MSPSERRSLRIRAVVLALAALGVLASAIACGSDRDNVCESIGNCEQGGSSDWIDGCKSEAKLLDNEAYLAGCGTALGDYYGCAHDNFECHGATSSFPGCEAKLAAVNDCLTKATTQTACAELRARTASCTPMDGGADAAPAVAPACTASRDCQARCFLDNVKSACAPALEELATFATCASMCPID